MNTEQIPLVSDKRVPSDTEVAARLGVSPFTVRAWRRKGQGPTLHENEARRPFRSEDVEEGVKEIGNPRPPLTPPTPVVITERLTWGLRLRKPKPTTEGSLEPHYKGLGHPQAYGRCIPCAIASELLHTERPADDEGQVA